MNVIRSHRWALRKAARVVLASGSLAAHTRYMWPVLEPGVPLVWNWHADAVCDHVERLVRGDLKRLVLNIPPGTMKTWIGQKSSVTYRWLHEPGERFMCIANKSDLATEVNRDVRHMVTSPRYRMLVDELGLDWTLTAGRQRDTHFENTARGFRSSFGLTDTFLGFRGSVQIIDDPHKQLRHNVDQARAQVEQDNRVIFRDLVTRVQSIEHTPRLLIMQRVHPHDATSVAIKAGWDVLCLPMEYDPDHPHAWPDDPRTKRGELLFPERFPREALDAIKAEQGAHMYETQYQQRPSVQEGGQFQRSWFQQRYPEPPDVQYRSCFEVVIGVDCAGLEEHTGHDYTAMAVWGRVGEHLFLLDEARGQWGIGEQERQLYALCRKWPKATIRLIENASNGIVLLRRAASNGYACTPVSPRGKDKETRAHPFALFAEGGRLWLPRGEHAPWVEDWIDEVCAFGVGGAYRDRVDATAYVIERFHNRQTGAVQRGPTIAGLY